VAETPATPRAGESATGGFSVVADCAARHESGFTAGGQRAGVLAGQTPPGGGAVNLETAPEEESGNEALSKRTRG
jgi:hypothetical protein